VYPSLDIFFLSKTKDAKLTVFEEVVISNLVFNDLQLLCATARNRITVP
jgi:hypothetical protein